MGVIKRQGFKQSIVSYGGVLIGIVSTMFIYPLDKEIYGLAQFLLATAALLSPFILMGSTGVSTRFFPDFKHKKSNHHGFWLFLHSFVLVGILLTALFLFLLKDPVNDFLADKPFLYQTYAVYIIPIGVLVSFLQLNINYCANFKRIAIPGVFQIFIKITLPVLILLYYYKTITLPVLAMGLVANYVLAVVGVIFYLWHLGELYWAIDFSFLKKDRVKKITRYGGFALLSAGGAGLAFKVDSLMIATLIDFQQNGVYNIALFIGSAIGIPAQALLAIAAPLIADSLQRKDLDYVKDIYQRGSTNLFWIGMLLFCLAIVSVEDLFSIMSSPEEMQGAFWVVFFIALSKMIEMATSTNHQILAFSKFYHYNLYMIVMLSVLNILFNLLFIPMYGIAGAAVATMLSLSLYNMVKVGLIYWKFKLQPFTKASIYICLLGLLVLAIVYGIFYQLELHPITAVVLKSMLVAAIYFPIAFWLKISPDINEIIVNVWQRFLKVLNR